MRGRGARLGDKKATGGVSVEPMNEARRFALLVRQAFEHAVDMALGAGPALHCQPVRLVEDKDLVVLVKHKLPEKCRVTRVDARRILFFGSFDRGTRIC